MAGIHPSIRFKSNIMFAMEGCSYVHTGWSASGILILKCQCNCILMSFYNLEFAEVKQYLIKRVYLHYLKRWLIMKLGSVMSHTHMQIIEILVNVPWTSSMAWHFVHSYVCVTWYIADCTMGHILVSNHLHMLNIYGRESITQDISQYWPKLVWW